MRVVRWRIETGEGAHDVRYAARALSRRAAVSIDGEEFSLRIGLPGLRTGLREPFLLGSEPALLLIDRRGRPSLLFRGAEAPPAKGR